MYAGNVLGKVIAKPGPNGNDRKVLSIRPTCFDKAELVDSSSVEMETLDSVQAFGKAEWVGESVSKSDRPDLSSASIVVSGGRGIKSGENFPILEGLADKLGVSCLLLSSLLPLIVAFTHMKILFQHQFNRRPSVPPEQPSMPDFVPTTGRWVKRGRS